MATRRHKLKMSRQAAWRVKSMLKWIAGLSCAPFFWMSPLQAHFLWKVEGETPSFLYGTLHSSSPLVRDIPPAVLEALDGAASFHPELELSPENLGRMAAAMFSSGPGSLEEELPPELWRRLLRRAESLGLPEVLLRRVPLQLAPLLLASPPGEEFDRIVDVQLYIRARESGIRIQELESVDEQMEVFRSMPREVALTLLQEALLEVEEGYPNLQKILHLYHEGDLEELFRFLRDEWGRHDLPILEERLLVRRNHLMVDRLAPFLKKGGAFAAIGAGHMPGDKGIVELLRRRGFTVEEVTLREPSSAE